MFSGNDFSGILQQHEEDAERLVLYFYANALAGQCAPSNIDLKKPKAQYLTGRNGVFHRVENRECGAIIAQPFPCVSSSRKSNNPQALLGQVEVRSGSVDHHPSKLFYCGDASLKVASVERLAAAAVPKEARDEKDRNRAGSNTGGIGLDKR